MNEEITRKQGALRSDIVVIGGGGAGLAAAVAATENGASVIVLEKRGLGGNSARAFGLFAAESPTQRRQLIDCRVDDCFKIAMNFAHWKIDPGIVRTFIEKSGDTVRWLEEKGLVFTCIPFYPGQTPVTWHVPRGRGAEVIKVMAQNCRKRGVQILTNTPARRILTDSKERIIGVAVTDKEAEVTIETNCVIIATGGYGGNKEMLKKYCSAYRENENCVGTPQEGDGINMAAALGAASGDTATLLLGGPGPAGNIPLNIGTPPNVFRIGSMPLAIEPYTIWVNKKGERFTDETLGFTHFQSSIPVARQPENISYTLFDHQMVQTMIKKGLMIAIETELVIGANFPGGLKGDRLPGLDKALQEQSGKGLILVSESWGEIADWIGAKRETLQATIAEYNTNCDRGRDSLYAKDRIYLQPLRIPPYYALKCGAGFLNTIGGIKINTRTEVLDKEDNIIPGLYAAGVDTSGWESDTYCDFLSGHAFGFALNSGRIAGENAAMFISYKYKH